MIDERLLRKGDISESILEQLEKADAQVSLAAMLKFYDSDLRKVRNLDGFLKGIITRIERDGDQDGEGDLRK